jgi:hypothetical protein
MMSGMISSSYHEWRTGGRGARAERRRLGGPFRQRFAARAQLQRGALVEHVGERPLGVHVAQRAHGLVERLAGARLAERHPRQRLHRPRQRRLAALAELGRHLGRLHGLLARGRRVAALERDGGQVDEADALAPVLAPVVELERARVRLAGRVQLPGEVAHHAERPRYFGRLDTRP